MAACGIILWSPFSYFQSLCLSGRFLEASAPALMSQCSFIKPRVLFLDTCNILYFSEGRLPSWLSEPPSTVCYLGNTLPQPSWVSFRFTGLPCVSGDPW